MIVEIDHTFIASSGVYLRKSRVCTKSSHFFVDKKVRIEESTTFGSAQSSLLLPSPVVGVGRRCLRGARQTAGV